MAKTKTKAAEVELDAELETDEATEKPAKGKGKSDEVEFGVADLCAYIKEETGKEYSTRDMRTLLRKMAREDKPRVEREVIAGNRARYDWPGGPKNAEVKKILKAVSGGEIEEGKKEALAKLKEQKAAKAAKAEGKKGKGKGKKAKVEEDDDVTFEDDDD